MHRTALVGAGYIAREHLTCLRSLRTTEMVGICDLSPAMAEATAEEFGVPRWFTDHREMLDELRPDVVHVTTPAPSHVPLALDALDAGAHVLVEKPITLVAADFARLKAAAEAKGRLVLENHNYLFNAPVQRILERIRQGLFGDVVHVEATFCVDLAAPGSRHADPDSPHPSSRQPGGAISDFVTHLAYLTHAFVGEHRAVSTAWRKRSSSVGLRWDELRVLVDAERGTAALGFSAHSKPEVFSLRIHGTKMRATASLFEPLIAFEREWNAPRPLFPVLNGLAVARAYADSAFGGLWRKLAGRPVTYDGLWRLLELLYEALATGAAPPLALGDVEAANRLVWEILRQEPPA